MIKAKGIAAQSAKSKLAPFSFERRDPKENDVVIDIKFCGICHSDIHQAKDEWGGSMFPMVPGHEIAGVVRAVGSKVTKIKLAIRLVWDALLIHAAPVQAVNKILNNIV